ncbi:MAG TPA: adenine deaminase [Methanolinea sp.]|nr:adenine deaminase [Methanolinea sp.]
MEDFPSPAMMRQALGKEPADALFKNACVYDPFTCGWIETDIAVASGKIVGLGSLYKARNTLNLKGRRVVPGLIDAHVHVESSLLVPSEYARVVAMHGTTSVVADPHEIANVCGKAGIEYMLREREGLPVDIFIMLPSCVPATPLDRGGAELTAEDLSEFIGRDGVLGLGEVMNVPGVLERDEGVFAKLALCSIRDGHAPLLSGESLNAYILAGLQSDHECTGKEEAAEKLSRGMFIFAREGSTEKNLRELIPLASPCTASRIAFATDDRHADSLVEEGHIDDCIRKSLEYGLELEIVLRMATLSAADRFGLHDRGALAPGRNADFCILLEDEPFSVLKTFKSGKILDLSVHKKPRIIPSPMRARAPTHEDLAIKGEGTARVIGIVPHQILTEHLAFELEGAEIPDLDRDILKVVVCNRYREGRCGLGLVHGFGLKKGAIAGSIAHDAHNLVAVGADDQAIREALGGIIRNGGGMAVAGPDSLELLPLDCGGLMSSLPAEEVAGLLKTLNGKAVDLGAIPGAFMYLSFLSLTVIPHLRVTDRGMFDADVFRDVPLFR